MHFYFNSLEYEKKVISMDKTFPTSLGHPFTLGVQKKNQEHAFCIHIDTAKEANLIVKYGDQLLKFPTYKEGSRFHIKVGNLPSEFTYAYQITDINDPSKSYLVSDPYSKALTTHFPYGNFNESEKEILSYHYESEDFNWGTSSNFEVDREKLVIYEMHIKGFTQLCNLPTAGTFKAAIEKIPYLKSLGINAIELLPIMEFNECEISFSNPQTQERLVNYWGYSTLSFFSIMKRFSTVNDPRQAEIEFKEFVKACHEAQIAVVLDVVYNHTGEIYHLTNLKSYNYLSPSNYYILDGKKHTNFTGCGNTFNCNSKIATQLIIDSLKHFSENYKIDGFRFDLASIFMRDPTGTPVSHPPIIEAIQNDPLLIKKLLISEPWDAVGLYHVGNFPKPFLEWNGWYRDTVRQFFNVGNIYITDIIECLSACPRLYSRYKKPQDSVNFITCHDGFSLLDLVSYQSKHNEANGEENRDGNNHNLSINFGIEGPTEDPTIKFLRKKQILNFYSLLFASFGTPMFFMGDESGHSKNGNNNSWCQNNSINFMNWEAIDPSILNGVKLLISIRKSIGLYASQSYDFLKDLKFMDAYGKKPDAHSYGNFIAMTFYDSLLNRQLYFAFNSSPNAFIVQLPKLEKNEKWKLQFNSYELIGKKDFDPHFIENEYPITGQTCLIAFSSD